MHAFLYGYWEKKKLVKIMLQNKMDCRKGPKFKTFDSILFRPKDWNEKFPPFIGN